MNSDLRDMNAAALLKLHDLDEADLAMVRRYGLLVEPKTEHFLDGFYAWIGQLPEYQVMFTSSDMVRRVRGQQSAYWHSFFAAHVDDRYIKERRRIGETHARIGLSLPSYFASMNYSSVLWSKTCYDGSMTGDDFSAALSAFNKLMHLDITLVVDTYSRLVNERIAEQSKALLEMSTPVSMVWRDILMLPVVGLIDSRRADDIMSTVLQKIADTRARVFILDISGVAVVDSAVANHFIKITKATRLMGCHSLVSGVSPAIAQTIVQLGIDVNEVNTTATLRDALEQAFKRVGSTVSDSRSNNLAD